VGRRRRSRRAAGLTPERLPGGHLDRYVALDGLLAFEELAGFALSNRPQESDDLRARAAIVILAERFPSEGDPLVEFVETLEDVRVEAAARPEPPAPRPARELRISYREDEGLAERAGALVRIVVRHPWRSLLDVAIRRSPGEPSLARLAPAALRLERDRPLRIQPLGGDGTRTIAARLAALTGIDDHGRTPSG
jgi:hypothetical protein